MRSGVQQGTDLLGGGSGSCLENTHMAALLVSVIPGRLQKGRIACPSAAVSAPWAPLRPLDYGGGLGLARDEQGVLAEEFSPSDLKRCQKRAMHRKT